MTVDQLLEAMRSAQITSEGEGVTVVELCSASGMGDDKARKMLRQLMNDGSVRLSFKWIRRIDGITTKVPSYVLVEKAKAKRGRA